VHSAVEQQLLNTLSEMRYNPGKTTVVQRPRKADKLPPGASYTSTPAGLQVNTVVEGRVVEEVVDEPTTGRRRRRTVSDSSSSSNTTTEDDSFEESCESEAEVNDGSEGGGEVVVEPEKRKTTGKKAGGQKAAQGAGEATQAMYPAGRYIAAVYQEDWYVGQVLDKEVEPEAAKGEEYLYVNFMERGVGDVLKWPVKLDMLNVLESDVLCNCDAPEPVITSSSSRSSSFRLSKNDLKTVKHTFMIYQAYYLNKAPVFSLAKLFLFKKKFNISFMISSWIC